MGTIYAYVYGGIVMQIIQPFINDEGQEVPIDQVYSTAFVACCVDLTGISPQPMENWTYDGTAFHPPSAPVLTPAQILAANTATRNQYLAAATLAIAPLQDAVDIGEATAADTAMLTAWKTFRVAVNRVVLTLANPTWPTPPQPGYGAAIAPPVISS